MPSSKKVDLVIEPATEADIPEMIEAQFSAFENDPFQMALYPGDYYSPELRASANERNLKWWRSEKTAAWCKCVDRNNGRIIGMAAWSIFEKSREEAEWRARMPVDWCTGREKEVAENLFASNARVREEIWEGRPYMGTLLVQWGLDVAQSKGLACHLEASPDGFFLYKKLGFRVAQNAVIKASDYDGPRDLTLVVMIKDPDQTSSSAVNGDGVGKKA